MNILMASTPATGHLNPMLAIARILIEEGHAVTLLTGTRLRDRVERAGARFRPLPGKADFDPADVFTRAPELKTLPPGPQWHRLAFERLFADSIAPQFDGIQDSLLDSPADVIVADSMFFGVLPMLLGPRAKRPPVVLCGTSFLHWRRPDDAPHFAGLPPARNAAERDEHAALAREFDRLVDRPIAAHLNPILRELGVGPLETPILESVVALSDAFIQLTIPGFEYPRDFFPPSVHFVGTPPIIPGQAPLPPWAHELDGSRQIVLITQGTVANHNLGLLIAPALAALASEPDVLVVVTTGGRPIEAIPGPIPPNARLASYLPFEWLLPQVDAFVTNGGYGSVNQALSFGIPLVTAGLTEDKASVNARVAWSGVGIDLATNEPTADALRVAIRSVLDQPRYRQRAAAMADEYAEIDTRSEILGIIGDVVVDEQTAIVVQRTGIPLAGRGRRAIL